MTEKKEPIDTTRKTYKEESTDLSDIALEGHEEEVRERKYKKILTPKRLLAILPILSAQIKAGNNSYKLKNEIWQILYLLHQYKKSIKKVYKNFIKPL